MRSTGAALRWYYREWPWPTKLPLKKDWFPHLSRTQSIASESKQVHIVGDVAVIGVLAFSAWRFWSDRISGVHQSRLNHLTGAPPAIIAQNFDFTDPSKNRTVDRNELDTYRNEFVQARANRTDVEQFIFKY